MNIFLVILALPAIAILFLSVYTRVMEKIDDRKFAKEKSSEHRGLVSLSDSEATTDNKSDFKKKLKLRVYSFLTHWGYGWMRLSILAASRLPSNRMRYYLQINF